MEGNRSNINQNRIGMGVYIGYKEGVYLEMYKQVYREEEKMEVGN